MAVTTPKALFRGAATTTTTTVLYTVPASTTTEEARLVEEARLAALAETQAQGSNGI